MHRAALGIAVALAAVLAGTSCDDCGAGGDRDRIARTLDERDAALSTGDAARFLATLAENYLADPGLPLTESERLARYFRAGASFEAQSGGRVISVDGDEAKVTQHIRYVIHDAGGGKTLDFRGVERLALVRRNGAWRVTSARQDLDRILALLETRRGAMETGDLALYLTTISPRYSDGGFAYADVERYVAALLAARTPMRYRVLARSIRVQDNAAEAIQEFTLSRADADPAREAPRGKERLLLGRDADGNWRITGGLTIRPPAAGEPPGAGE